MPLLNALRGSLQRNALLQRGARVVVAVSGGPDSLCLLHLLWRLRDERDLRLHIVHLDHGFRGAESAAEAAFVAAVAQRFDISATIVQRDVPAFARAQRLNAQAAARSVRYELLAEVAQAQRADAVAVAHHADDQAETVLMHILRGAGPAGLRGMRRSVPWQEWASTAAYDLTNASVQPALIRPLLDVDRAAIEAYCDTHALHPRRDPSNTSPRYTRSRVRADLLPVLSVYNQHINQALTHTAAICADDYAFIQEQLDACWPALISRQNDQIVAFNAEQWQALHPSLQRYAVRRAIAWLQAEAEVSFEQIEAVRHMARGGVGTQLSLPGELRLVVGYHGFVIGQAHAHVPFDGPQLAQPEVAVLVPGTTVLGNGWHLTIDDTPQHAWEQTPWTTVLDAATLDAALRLRVREPGDRLRPSGGTGSRRLQDLFVDNKLPSAARAAWPLLVAATDIVWVIGVRSDARFQPTAHTTRRLWVRCWQALHEQVRAEE